MLAKRDNSQISLVFGGEYHLKKWEKYIRVSKVALLVKVESNLLYGPHYFLRLHGQYVHYFNWYKLPS